MTISHGLRKSLPFCFRRRAPGPECPPQAQPYPFLTPQTQKVRQPTVEEGAIPRCRAKTTGDMSRVWASPNISESPVPTTGGQMQTPPPIDIPASKTPDKSRWTTSPPTTPPRRYTPQVTDFALPRHRRYRLSLQWEPRQWDEEDPKESGSPLQESFSTDSRSCVQSNQCSRLPSVVPHRKLIYSLEDLAEHP